MPLILQVVSYRDQPLAGRYAVFAGDTGTFGRAEGNDLVLQDPGKYISRTHARVERRGEQFYLTDIGSNPSVVNDRLLGHGQETRLEEGDSITVGEYRLEVRLHPATTEEEAGAVGNDAATQTQNLTLAVFEPAASLPINAVAPPPEIDTLSAPQPSRTPPTPSTNPPDALAAARILENGSLLAAQLPLADPLGLNLFAHAHDGQMPGLNHPHDEHWQPAFRGAENDHLSPELQALPAPVGSLNAASASTTHATSHPSPLLIPADYDPLADVLATPKPSPLPAPEAALTAVSNEAAPPAAEPILVAPPASAATACTDDGVLQALLEGLGLPDLRTHREPRDLARLAGEMLREAVGGTMDILLARSMTKRDSHIDMTMIGARSNNPLKFFPNPESALSQMLIADAPAYLPGVTALAAAFDDLKAHELAVIVGMRAALGEVVQRFEPARIEQRLSVPGRFDKLMPGTRKARLWDLLTALYADLVRDGDEDVQRIFGEKFALAYLEQIGRLRADR